NLGGVHRLIERLFGRYLYTPTAYTSVNSIGRAGSFVAGAEGSLPGGETIFDDNYVRLGSASRSLTSQLIVAVDDVGYSANTAAVFRRDPFFANVAIVADT